MQIERVFLNDVLFTLYAAQILEWPDLNRTNFQKILYFCAVLAPLAKIDWGYDFTNAQYGPFKSNIQDAVDRLVPYGYARPTEITLQKDSKLRARYKITSRGNQEVERICHLKKEKERLDWIIQIMKVLDVYGPKIVMKLVYNEPTFNKIRKQNQRAIDLSLEENGSIELVEKFSTELDQSYSIQLDTLASKLIVYFDFLSSDIGRGIGE